MSRWSLDGYHCIVTGGSKGLGLACVSEMLQLGATVLMTARGEADLASAASTLSSQYGSRVHTIAADVSTAEGRMALVARATELWGGVVDVLVNNVGTNRRKSVEEATEDDYDEMVRTNQTSAFFLCKACLPLLRRRFRQGSHSQERQADSAHVGQQQPARRHTRPREWQQMTSSSCRPSDHRPRPPKVESRSTRRTTPQLALRPTASARRRTT